MIAAIARALKQLLAATLYRSGLLALWWRMQGVRLRSGPLIVTYHRVLPASAAGDLSQAGIVVTTETFARQLRLLAKHFRLVPLAEAVRSRDPGLCAITFDDGWADNHAHALPLLAVACAPATLFVVTDLVGSDRLFWPERLAHLLAGPERTRLPAGAIDGLPAAVHAALLAAARAPQPALALAVDRLIETAKEMGEEEREDMLALIARHTGRSTSGLAPRLLDWDRVRAMAAAGIEIGAHGATHAILTRIEFSRAIAEIRGARERLAAELGRPPASFAYPNGNASPELARAVRDAGYALAVVTDEPPDPGCPPGYAIRRKNLAEGSSRGFLGFSAAIFACEILGFFDGLRRTGHRSAR